MNPATRFRCLLVCSLLAPACAMAGQWFSLARRDSRSDETTLEVDLESVHLRGSSGEALIRITFDVLQPHPGGFGYRSFIATAQVDCQHQSVALDSAAYFALPRGEGARVGVDSSGRAAGMPTKVVESIPTPQRSALVRAACSPSGQ